jgi:hypothetical protein
MEERSIGRGREPWIPKSLAWWQRGVIYQIYPWSFADASGDGIGDLRGIREHAEYLGWLGIDAVWLSPIFPSPGVDLGYDVSDYRDVDPRFGTLRDLDDLVVALHAVDVRLILDLVPNHSSDRHPWFEESRRDRTNPRHDWYVWRDPSSDGSPPNNWESYFGGPAWTFLDPPGQWYLHSFDPGQPDLNWANPPCARRSGTRCGSGSVGGSTASGSMSYGSSARIPTCATTRRTPIGATGSRTTCVCSATTRRTDPGSTSTRNTSAR